MGKKRDICIGISKLACLPTRLLVYSFTRLPVYSSTKNLLTMLRTLLSFIPFYVYLFWLIAFIAHYRKSDLPQKILTFFSGHMHCALPMPWALLHRGAAARDGESLDAVLAVGLSALLHLYLPPCVAAESVAQVAPHSAAWHRRGDGKISLPGRCGGRGTQVALCRSGFRRSLFRISQTPCLRPRDSQCVCRYRRARHVGREASAHRVHDDVAVLGRGKCFGQAILCTERLAGAGHSHPILRDALRVELHRVYPRFLFRAVCRRQRGSLRGACRQRAGR